jgi:RNA polymerase sigma-70 factor, ECF subfamily
MDKPAEDMEMTPLNRESLAGHCPRLYRVALRILGNHHSAEEIVQEVCVKVLDQKESHRLNGAAQPTTWLHRVTVNCALDRVRRENLEERSRPVIDAGRFRQPLPSPDQVAERQELFSLATSHVATLPDEYRTAFLLTQIDGYSYDEAAEIEGTPRGTIASRVARAKSLLLAALEEAHT